MRILMSLLTLALMETAIFAGAAKQVNSEKDFNALLAAGKPVLADFFATWCPPCKKLAPTIDALAKKYSGKVNVVKIDVDKNRDWISRFNISGIPDVRIFHKGKEVKKLVGLRSEKDYTKQLDKLL